MNTTGTPQELTYKNLKIICYAIALSGVIYAGLIYFLINSANFTPQEPSVPQQYVFIAFTLIGLVLPYVLQQVFAKTPAQSLSQHYTHKMLIYVAAETSYLFAVVLSVMYGWDSQFMVLFGIGALYAFLLFPKEVSPSQFQQMEE